MRRTPLIMLVLALGIGCRREAPGATTQPPIPYAGYQGQGSPQPGHNPPQPQPGLLSAATAARATIRRTSHRADAARGDRLRGHDRTRRGHRSRPRVQGGARDVAGQLAPQRRDPQSRDLPEHDVALAGSGNHRRSRMRAVLGPARPGSTRSGTAAPGPGLFALKARGDRGSPRAAPPSPRPILRRPPRAPLSRARASPPRGRTAAEDVR